MKLVKKSDELYVTESAVFSAGEAAIALVKAQAEQSKRRRARICAHRDNADLLHEMLIAIRSDSYIHPHKHLEKSESFHIVEGAVDIVFFSDDGGIAGVMELGERASGRAFFYRLSEPRFHTLVIRSDVLVIHEVTNGPFIKNETVLAPFAPKEEDQPAASEYMSQVRREADRFIRVRASP